MTFLQAIVLSIVEGITEYLPISSTGHIILTSAIFGINEDRFTQLFTVMVQFGAVLAVVVEYYRLLLGHKKLLPVLAVAFLPAAVIGFGLRKILDQLLGSPWVVAVTLIIGGIVLIFTDRIFRKERVQIRDVNAVNYKKAVSIGFFQCLAMIPGTSRSAATIWGGMANRMDQRTATEFSFLLALPTLTAAALYKGLQGFQTFSADEWKMIILGNVISFFVGWLTIRTFIKYVARHSFKVFGYYRIALGLITIALLLLKP